MPAGSLARVHGMIGMLHQRLERLAVLRIGGHPDTDAGQLVLGSLEQALEHRDGSLFISIGEEHAEFIPPSLATRSLSRLQSSRQLATASNALSPTA